MRPPDTRPPGGDRAAREQQRRGDDDSRIITHRTAGRHQCRHCGQLAQDPTCRTCAAWLRVYHAHQLMSAALAEVGRG